MRQIAIPVAMVAMCILGNSTAFAQGPQPAVPSVTADSEAPDSGVGADDPNGWVGKTVVTADAREVGPVASVRVPSDTADSGVLLVEHEGRTVEVPILGASVDGDRVIVASTFERLTAN